MQQHSGYSRRYTMSPPLPKTEPPNDPPYEIIEFSSQQQYSNTPPFITKQNRKNQLDKKCDLCGCSNAQFHCDMCNQQTFCISCDRMYHRHPKRQTHIRKRIPQTMRERSHEPPLPPKGELSPAPVPPPRRNKRFGRKEGLSSMQQNIIKKEGSLMGSLKRFVGGMQNTTPQSKCETMFRNNMKLQKTPYTSPSTEFDQQSGSRDSGYLEWENDSRHRSNSFSAFNGPTFPSLVQAQSMAQLNCPNCHVHGMPAWHWNRSQMNLNSFQPWSSLAAGNSCHQSMMFAPPYAQHKDGFVRRGSLHIQRQNRKAHRFNNEEETESDLSISDERKSRKRSSPMKNISPALSRRSRTVASDTEEETSFKRNNRRYKKRNVPMSRDPSPALSRRSYHKKYELDDSISVKSVGSRRNLKPSTHKSFSKKNITRSSSDSDDELTSERDGNERRNPSNSFDSTMKFDPYQKFEKLSKEKDGLQFLNKSKQPAADISKDILSNQNENGDWECEHCTYLNTQKSYVCDVCCKSKMWKEGKESNVANDNTLEESMQNLNISTSTDGEKKKGDKENNNDLIKKTTSIGTSPPPQTIWTQTYDIPNYVGKRNRSFSCDDYSDWNSVKRSNSIISITSSDKQSTSTKQSQSPEHVDPVLENQTKRTLLMEAEKHQFEIEDVIAALAQCGGVNPIKWLLENWNKMIDTVVTLATNYGREQAENTVGTVSSSEAQAALRLHNGDIWAAATECVRQRQRKFAKLMSKGNFTREDVVTVLTANHGDIETAYMELNKNQLKPFLMKIWGPPQGLDNDSGNTTTLYNRSKEVLFEKKQNDLIRNCKLNFNRIQSWLETTDFKSSNKLSDDNDNKNDCNYIMNRDKIFALDDPFKVRKIYNSFTSSLNEKPTHYSSFDNLKISNKYKLNNNLFYKSLDTLNSQNNLFENFSKNMQLLSMNHLTSDDELNDDTQYYMIDKYIKNNVEIQRNISKAREIEGGLISNTDKNISTDCSDNEYYNSAEDLNQKINKNKLSKIISNFISAIKTNIDLNEKESNENLPHSTTFLDIPENFVTDTKKPDTYSSFLQILIKDNSSLPLNLTEKPLSAENSRMANYNLLEKQSVLDVNKNDSSPSNVKELKTNDIFIIDELRENEERTKAFLFVEIPDTGINYNVPKTENHKEIIQTSSSETNQIEILNSNQEKVLNIKNSVSLNPHYKEDEQIKSQVQPQKYKNIENIEDSLVLTSNIIHAFSNVTELKNETIPPLPTQISDSLKTENDGGIDEYYKTTLNYDNFATSANEYFTSAQTMKNLPIIEKKNFKQENDNELFFELKALYLLARHQLDFYLIEMKDTVIQDVNSSKLLLINDNFNDEPFQSINDKSIILNLTDIAFYKKETTGKPSSLNDKKVTSNNVSDRNLLKRDFKSIKTDNLINQEIGDKNNFILCTNVKSENVSISRDVHLQKNNAQNEIPDKSYENKKVDVDEIKNENFKEHSEENEINRNGQIVEEEISNLKDQKPCEILSSIDCRNENENDDYESKNNKMNFENNFLIKDVFRLETNFIPSLKPNEEIENENESIDKKRLILDAESKLNDLTEIQSSIIDTKKVNEDHMSTNIIQINIADKVTYAIKKIYKSNDEVGIRKSSEVKIYKNKEKTQRTELKQQNVTAVEIIKNNDNIKHENKADVRNENEKYSEEKVFSEKNNIISYEFSERLENKLNEQINALRTPTEKKTDENNDRNRNTLSLLQFSQSTIHNCNEDFNEKLNYENEDYILETKNDIESKISNKTRTHENEDTSFKNRVYNYLSEGLVSTHCQAEIAARLVELEFDLHQSIDAAMECSSIQAAITYLQQECQLCTERFSMKQMITMLGCEHKCCQECAQLFFSVQINEKSIDDCVCPFCKEPNLSNLDSDAILNYFSNLDILLKTILKPQTHELFQQKLRDRTLMQDPNFKWCPKCSFGFIADFEQKHISCPSCITVSCVKCGKPYEKEHFGKTCEEFNKWVEEQNDSDLQLKNYLENYGITCPKCDTKFILVKGGCMHLTCIHCKYEFCSDCLKPFRMGSDCKLSEYCVKLGLHAHHPRNCLFYLRDKEPGELKQLLNENNVQISLETTTNKRCNVQLQKENDNELIDVLCNAQVEEGGLCRCHLREYFSRLIHRHKLDTIDLLTTDDLETIVIREGKKRPPRGYKTPENEYYAALYQLFLILYARRTHYVEFLAGLIRKNKIDPLVIFDLTEILQEFRRHGKSLPIRKANSFEHEYRHYCVQIVKEEIPLE